VVRAVLARSLLIAGVGALIGLAMALLATRSIESMLFGVETVDTITYVGALGAVVLVTALAAAVPAWRASRVDPVQALSAE
jgi:ABC-type antimicrobial peptide transport system permease subunit